MGCQQCRWRLGPKGHPVAKSKAKKAGSQNVKRKRVTTPTAGRKPASHSAKPHATKTATCVALLSRAGGATLTELQKATGWQLHSVRGFLSGTLKKKLGLNLTSDKPDDGLRRYRVDHATG
jgi:hypothetical protein